MSKYTEAEKYLKSVGLFNDTRLHSFEIDGMAKHMTDFATHLLNSVSDDIINTIEHSEGEPDMILLEVKEYLQHLKQKADGT